MSISALEASLTAGPAPVYVVVGDAVPLVEGAVERIRVAVEPMLGPVAFNLTVLRASEPEAVEAFRTARTLPMMGARRLVIVREIESASDAFFEAAVAYLAAPVAEAVVVLQGQKFPKVVKGGSDWGQRIRKGIGAGLLVRLAAKDVRPAAFAQECAAGLGKRLSSSDARLLVEVVGEDLARLTQEVTKLSLYVGDEPVIGADDIHAATALLAEAVIWDLTAAIAAGNVELAIESLHRLQDGGDDPRRLLSMIAWQARDLLRLHARVVAGVPEREIRTQIRMRPDVYQAARERMKRGFPHPARLMGRLADANRAMNSHRAGAERVLEALVLDLVAAPEAERTMG